MRIFLSAGEPSGDLHASNLVRELKKVDPSVECVGFGGERMAQAGCQAALSAVSAGCHVVRARPGQRARLS